MSKFRREQTLREEKANYITHGLGVLFAIIAIPFMVTYALEQDSVSTIWGVVVFGFAMLMVYGMSTTYHAVQQPNLKRTLRIWDHISIFIMIGGSYTPLVIKYTDDATATVFLTAMWGIIAVGSLLKVFYTGRYVLLEVLIYLALGWMAVFIINPLISNMPPDVFSKIVYGGILYSIGVVFYLWKQLHYHHAVWHSFVLAGTVTHFFAVYNSIPVNIKF